MSAEVPIEYFPALRDITISRHAFIQRIPGIDVSHDKAEALKRLDRLRPDLVLLDIQLPGRDGYELLQELKGLPERSWKVVALTAHALPEDRTRASAAGFDGYITKPIDVRTFPAEVARYLGG